MLIKNFMKKVIAKSEKLFGFNEYTHAGRILLEISGAAPIKFKKNKFKECILAVAALCYAALEWHGGINVTEEVEKEREYQKEKWGDEFDSKNTPNDWIVYIINYTGKTFIGNKVGYIKVLALTAAAYEWADRGMAKRHYDE